MWILLSGAALAADDCSLTADEVRDAASRSEAAIADDDARAHRELFDDLLERVGCLDQVVPPRSWAKLLLSEVIVRFARGTESPELLAAALRADPELVVPSFLTRDGAPDPRLTPAPGHLRHPRTWVDGVAIDGPVELTGLHLVQAATPDGVKSWLVTDGGFPAPLTGARRTGEKPWLGVALGGGWADREQRVDRPGELLADSLDRGPAFDGGVWGRVPIAGPLAVVADAAVRASEGELWPTAFAGPAVGVPELVVWAGAGIVAVPVDDVGERRLVVLPQPALGLHGTTEGDVPLDAWVGGGWTPGVWHAQARWGAGVARLARDLVLRVGTDVSAVGAGFEQEAPGSRHASVIRWTGALQLGVAAGR